jgi:phage terminase large subunit-like protein
MPMDKWDACAFPVQPDELKGRVCYGGLDLSSTTDITAFVLVFPPQDEADNYVVLPYFWIPEENVSLRVRRDHVPYDVWQKQGFLHTTEGNVVHYGYIEKFIETMGEQYNIARSPSTAGVRCRWCRTSRVWDLPSSRSGRGSKI